MANGSEYLERIWTRLGDMTDSEILTGMFIVALLLSYLYIKWHQRVFRQSGAQPTDSDLREWRGKPIEASQLKPTLEQVRLDYIAAWKAERGTLFHRNLLRARRRA